MSDLLVVDAHVADRGTVDVLVVDGRVRVVGPDLDRPAGARVLDGRGSSVVPGLHDHHVHLRALAAARSSVDLGPMTAPDAAAFGARLRAAAASVAPGEWVRAIGYHESVAGPLDRGRLDLVVAAVPVRVQHRSGAMWFLNSAAIDALELDARGGDEVERDSSGRATGRLFRADRWLRDLIPRRDVDLASVGRDAAMRGITGFTDADPERTADDLVALRDALPQRVLAMGPVGLVSPDDDRVRVGPVKVLLDDDTLPGPEELGELVAAAHAEDRSIALHCVTRAQLLVALLAIEHAGANGSDRIEHGAIVPDELLPRLRAARVTVVTQPNFVAERGDEYLRDVDRDDQSSLYRCASLLAAGIPVIAGTDAPFGGADPWAAMRAATRRTTTSGAVIGAGERVDAGTAIALFLASPAMPSVTRAIEPGAEADLCLIDGSVEEAVLTGDASVVATVVAGEVIYER